MSRFTSAQLAFARKWIDALRSGEWKQVRYRMHDGERHCCLGVAACLLRLPPATDPGSEWRDEDDAYVKVGRALGLLSMEDTVAYSVGDYWRFTQLNDNYGLTFPQIADEAEKLFFPPEEVA